MIAGYGLLAFRDPPRHTPAGGGRDEKRGGRGGIWWLPKASRSIRWVFDLVRDVEPGEAIFIDQDSIFYSRQCAAKSAAQPVHFRVCLSGAPRFGHRRHFGLRDAHLDGAKAWRTRSGAIIATSSIDVVIPIPDSSRPSAMELADKLGLPYREGFIKKPLHRTHIHHAWP